VEHLEVDNTQGAAPLADQVESLVQALAVL